MSAAARRPDPVVCRTCDHYGQKDRSQAAMSGKSYTGLARDVPERSKECLWFHTAAGRSADSDRRLAVMVAGANGGKKCEELAAAKP